MKRSLLKRLERLEAINETRERIIEGFVREGFSPRKVSAQLIDTGDAPYELVRHFVSRPESMIKVDLTKGAHCSCIWAPWPRTKPNQNKTIEMVASHAASVYRRWRAEKRAA